jgi:hypothetical protein
MIMVSALAVAMVSIALGGPRVLRQDAPAAPPAAQDPAPPSDGERSPAPVAQQNGDRVRVFLDCFDCFQQYLREEIEWVDFVRQPQDADVHLLSSSRGTGGGGREVVLRFIGRGRFEGHDHDLRAVTLVGDTENTRREVVLRTVLVGLLDYVAHDGIPPGVELEVSTDVGREQLGPLEDPWNLWVFEVGGDASLNRDERNREYNYSFEFSGDRVTADWKISFGGDVSQNVERFELDPDEEEDEDEPLEVRRQSREFDWFVGRSLGPHWSVGLRGQFGASTFNNNKVSASTSPAIEFSIFPYQDYATRQLLVTYDIGYERARYNEVTVFDKTEETLLQHEVAVSFDQSQPWGSLEAGVEFSQYLHDRSLYRVEVDGDVSVRITRGLSINVDGGASRIRDQISLPRRGATPEEILLRLRQLRSGYDVRFSIGLSYSFGSIFNNVVNPRFGRGGGDGGGGGGGFN